MCLARLVHAVEPVPIPPEPCIAIMLSRLFRREKLDQGVEKSRAGFFGKIRTLLTAERPIDDDLWDELEELLIQADVGVGLTDDLMERLRGEHRSGEIQN